jgi:hypothetical protein
MWLFEVKLGLFLNYCSVFVYALTRTEAPAMGGGGGWGAVVIFFDLLQSDTSCGGGAAWKIVNIQC